MSRKQNGLALLITVLLLFGAYLVGHKAPGGTTDLGGGDTAGWQTSLAYTTCNEYQTVMNGDQRTAAARWLLATFRRGEVADASDGSELASGFAPEISAACAQYYSAAPTTGVIAAATLAYVHDPNVHPVHH